VVALVRLNLLGAHGLAAARSVELSQLGSDHLDGLHRAVDTHDAVRRGQENETGARRLRRPSTSSRMAGISLRSRR